MAVRKGRYYTFTNARNEPKGPQRPTPPIVIGGAGPRRTMPLVAQWADHWNFPGGEVDKFTEAKARLAECCDEIGRDPAEITTSTHLIYRADDPIDNVLTQAEQYREAGLDLVVCRGFSAVDCDGSGVPRKAHRRSHTSSVRQGGATPRGASMPSRTRANKPTTHH